MESILKIEKTIEEINSQLVILHEGVKMQGINTFCKAEILEASFINEFRYSESNKKELQKVNNEKGNSLKTENAIQKKIYRVKKNLS